MKTIGIFLIILIFLFISGCGIMGGPTSVDLPRPTTTPMRWYQPVITFTPIPSVTAPAQIPISGNSLPPTLSVTIATNCRRGPSADYDILLAFFPGQIAAIVGKYTPTNYWVIQTANGYTCWLWGENAITTGDISLAPDYPVPPLPTSTSTPGPIYPASNNGPAPTNTLIPAPPSQPGHFRQPPKFKPFPPGNPFRHHGPNHGRNGSFLTIF